MRTIGKNVLVTQQARETTTAGGIIFKDDNQVTKATCIAVGEEVKTISVGDELVINWGAAVKIKNGTEECFVLHVDNIFAVV
jgi:co-chaperonin GroES (HSP10)